MELIKEAITNIKNILITNYKIKNLPTKVLIIYDEKSELSKVLKQACEFALKELNNDYEMLDFYSKTPEEIVENIELNYKKKEIVITIQSSSFRVSKYRWRNILCDRGLKVLEFGQLNKVKNNEIKIFIKSLKTDYIHYKKIADKLENKIIKSKEIKIISMDNSILKYTGPMDKCLKNIGELWNQTNWTSRFPIGEIISESLDLKTLNGEMLIYAFPNISEIETEFVKVSFKCTIKNGLLIKDEGPKEFKEIIKMIKTENEKGEIFIREFGLGLNRNIKRYDKISEPMAYERVEGLHFSIGMKHGMYQKKLWPIYGKKFYQRYHIDIFVDVKEIYIDDNLIFTYEKGYF